MSDVVFIGTAVSVEPKFLDPWDLTVQRRIRELFSEQELDRMMSDKSPEGIARIKAAYLKMYPDLPESFKRQLAQAGTADQLDNLIDSFVEQGSRTHFQVKEVFRGSGAESIDVWSDFSDCGVHFQIGETYLVYAGQDEDRHRLRTGACSRTNRVSDAGADLAYLFLLTKGGKESARLSGFVTSNELDLRTPRFWDRVNSPVSNAFVEIRGAGSMRYTETNREGRFIFDGLSPGSYTVSALDPGDDPVAPRAPRIWQPIQVPSTGCAPEPVLMVEPVRKP